METSGRNDSTGRPNGNGGQAVMRDDTAFLKSCFGPSRIVLHQKHPDDLTNVALWVKEFENAQENPFLIFHPLTAGWFFILGIQTKSQEEMLRRFGSAVICVDIARKTTQYEDFILVTLLVIADDSVGYPVAWFVVNQDTEEILTLCFHALRDRMGPIRTDFFMSHDAPQYFNAWASVFGDCGPEPRKLICKYRVKRDLEMRIRSKVPVAHRQSVRKAIDELIDAESEQIFQRLIVQFNRNMTPICPEFVKYFRTTYCNAPLRIQEWSLFGRQNACVVTNTYVDMFHNKLKKYFLDGKQNERLDKLVDVLINDAAPFYGCEYVVRRERFSPGESRSREMHNRHKDSRQLKEKVGDNVKMVEGGWLVPCEERQGIFHTVRQKRACDCLLKCGWCRVCPHHYSCTCKDMKVIITACKHIHLVHSTFGNPAVPRILQSATVDQQRSSTVNSVESIVPINRSISPINRSTVAVSRSIAPINRLIAPISRPTAPISQSIAPISQIDRPNHSSTVSSINSMPILVPVTNSTSTTSTNSTTQMSEPIDFYEGRTEMEAETTAINSNSSSSTTSPDGRQLLKALVNSCVQQVQQLERPPNEKAMMAIKQKFKEIEDLMKIPALPLAIPPSTEEFGPPKKILRQHHRFL